MNSPGTSKKQRTLKIASKRHINKAKDFLKGAHESQKRGLSAPAVVAAVYSTIQIGSALAEEFCSCHFNEKNIVQMPKVLEAEITIPKTQKSILEQMIKMRNLPDETISLRKSENILKKAETFNRWAVEILES